MYFKQVNYFLLGCIVFVSSCNIENENNVIRNFSCEQCPEISEGQDTLDFVNEIRSFVASKNDIGNNYNSLCDTFYKIPIERFDVDTFLTIFENDYGVTTCGLSSLMMVKILLENKINAYTYNFGFPNSPYTHVVVLVEVNNKLIVQDPYYNTYLQDLENKTIDFYDLIENIKTNSLNDVSFKMDTATTEIVLDAKSLKKMNDSEISTECLSSFKEIKNLNVDFKSPHKVYFSYKVMDCYDFITSFETELAKRNLPQNFLSAFTLKINEVYGAENHSELNNKIDSILAL